MVNILSLGAGVNSTALLLKCHQEIDAVIFADTGGELPETYAFIDKVIMPFCKNKDIEYIMVRSHHGTLESYCLQKRIIPYRMLRWCSDKFKKKPIIDFIKSHYDGEVQVMMGIDYGEFHRMKTSDKKGISNIFPLVDLKLDRKGCEDIIKSQGYDIPVKSGCYFCPFQPKSRLKWVLTEHPSLYVRAETMEKNGQKYPKATLIGTPLEQIRKAIINQRSLDEFESESPCGGWCMT